MALYRQWRPQSFKELVGQPHVSKTLSNAVQKGRINHAYLFCGPRGTGKTSTAKILAKAVNCLQAHNTGEPCNECESCRRITEGISVDVVEIDAASNRRVEEVRELRGNVQFVPLNCQYKVYIVDEVHMLTNEAFNALLKTLEEPPAHIIFMLATTEPYKLPATIISRCQRFDFRRVGLQDILNRLQVIAESLQVEVTDDALYLMAGAVDGGLRDAIGLLDQCLALGVSRVGREQVESIIGSCSREDIFELVDKLIRKETAAALCLVNRLIDEGKEVRRLLKDLIEHFRALILAKTGEDALELVRVTSDWKKRYQEQAGSLAQEVILGMIKFLTMAEGEMKWTGNSRLFLEMTLIRLVRVEGESDITGLHKRLQKLEDKINLDTSGLVTGETGRVSEPALQDPGQSSELVSKDTDRPTESEQAADQSPEPVPQDTSQVPKPVKDDTNRSSERADAGPEKPVITLKQVRHVWAEVLEKIRSQSRVMFTILKDSKQLKIDGTVLTIGLPSERIYLVNEAEKIDCVEKVLSSVLNLSLKVKYQEDVSLKPEQDSISETKAVSRGGDRKELDQEAAVLEIFGGEIINKERG